MKVRVLPTGAGVVDVHHGPVVETIETSCIRVTVAAVTGEAAVHGDLMPLAWPVVNRHSPRTSPGQPSPQATRGKPGRQGAVSHSMGWGSPRRARTSQTPTATPYSDRPRRSLRWQRGGREGRTRGGSHGLLSLDAQADLESAARLGRFGGATRSARLEDLRKRVRSPRADR